MLSGKEEKELYAPKTQSIKKNGSVNKASCSQIASVNLKISLPERKNGYRIDEVGFYIIPMNEKSKISPFPRYPLKATMNKNGECFFKF